MMAGGLQSKRLVPLQVIGFSALAKILHEFSYHFSPIRDWFLAGCEENGVYLKQAEPAPNMKMGFDLEIRKSGMFHAKAAKARRHKGDRFYKEGRKGGC
jgi:hypothetical protein